MYSATVKPETRYARIEIRPDGTTEISATPVRPGKESVVIEIQEGSGRKGAAYAIVKTTAEWEAGHYVPKKGEFIAYSDWASLDDKDVAGLKIGDGVTEANALPFLNGIGWNVLTDEEVQEILDSAEEPCPAHDKLPDQEEYTPDVMTDEELLELLNDGEEPEGTE